MAMSRLFKGAVALTLGNGKPIYINPDNVVAITESTGLMENIDYSIRASESGGKTLILTTGHGAFNHLIVRESVEDVMDSLTWKLAETD